MGTLAYVMEPWSPSVVSGLSQLHALLQIARDCLMDDLLNQMHLADDLHALKSMHVVATFHTLDSYAGAFQGKAAKNPTHAFYAIFPFLPGSSMCRSSRHRGNTEAAKPQPATLSHHRLR